MGKAELPSGNNRMTHSEPDKPSPGLNKGTNRSTLAYSLLQPSEFIARERILYLRQTGLHSRQTSSGLPRPMRVVAHSSFSQYRYSKLQAISSFSFATKKSEVA